MEVKRGDNRFYMKTEHGDAELLYDLNGTVMAIYHTYTPDEERGKGIAGKLAEAAFDYAKKNGLKVKPDCPFIADYVLKHKEIENLVVWKLSL